MATACVNNISVSPSESKPTPTYSSCGRLTDPPEIQATAAGDYEFRLEEDPVTMLPADELFSDGKLVLLHFSKQNPPVKVSSQETPKSCRRQVEPEISGKATRSSSTWREFLGLKKSVQNSNNQLPNSDNNQKSLKHFLNRSSKPSTTDSSLNLPLLKDSDNFEPVPVSSSSRLWFSSSSSSHELEDLPRLSLDSDKPSFNNHPSPNPFAPSRMRIINPKPGSGSDTNNQTPGGGGGTQRSDSPRMNSSGSYSANVRVAPVLNVVPLRGSSKSGSVFGFFSSSSPQKSANGGSSSNNRSKSLKSR
ncbi:S-adenosyl-L-methionine-dependent methyltransferases superfamily protein, putative isoform 1 [Hibiscus syriacus]|uniref:S-adenosyl-L-methionine-dependent methyltransferases superfamily protein, putative isoform 1 n=1 Tax=Hibiscus syriacus TaxID=106335 RepID=A0A6A2ZHH9_HIBSY|nr:S-adenosyl-L-methionine-dependent methyltransferases superfamily protein, putative isoform 1 [Hibiscus syriacus]